MGRVMPIVPQSTSEDKNWLADFKSKSQDINELNLSLREQVKGGYIWRANQVLKRGAEINFANASLLQCAANENDQKMFAFLVGKGSKIQDFQKDIVHRMIEKNQAQMLCFVFKKNYAQKPEKFVIEAMRRRHYEMVKVLVHLGADINYDNGAIIGWAAIQGELKIVEWLAKNGADIQRNNDYALRGAASNQRVNVMDVLLRYGADMHVQGDHCRRMGDKYQSEEIHKVLDYWQKANKYMKQPKTFSINLLNAKSFSGFQNEPPHKNIEHVFVQAARGGQFSAVIKMALKEKSFLTVADLTRTGKYGQSVVRILKAQNKLHQIFIPELWVKRPAELKKLWESYIPHDFKRNFDFETFLMQVNQAGFSKGKSGLRLKRRPQRKNNQPKLRPRYKR